MRLSNYFLPLLKEKPAEAQLVSHSLMLRSGMIKQQVAGIYSWLPLGLKVLRNIENIVRRNMNDISAAEILMPCIQPSSIWHESGRYESYGKEMLRITDRHENDLLFSPTNEEMATDIFRSYIRSYKDLPKVMYQIQWKFRDEIRPRFGIMRGREFFMKDGYSFDLTQEDAMKSYQKIYNAYLKIFRDIGVSVIPVEADAGAIGGNMNHEFHVIAGSGESTLYYDKRFDVMVQDHDIKVEELKGLYAVAEEKYDPKTCPLSKEQLSIGKGIEIGHIFYFGTKYSEPMTATVTSQDGQTVPVHMGSYGIGVSRLAAAIIEASHDDKGIIWPAQVAPFKVSIVNIGMKDTECNLLAEQAYKMLSSKFDVLYDDTDNRAGAKFACSDLIGAPWQLIIAPRSAAKGVVELKHRRTGEVEECSLDVALKKLESNLSYVQPLSF